MRHCPVSAIKTIAKEFPDLRIIAAHMGGMDRASETAEMLCGTENVYLDTSMSPHYVPQELFEKLIHRHGADKILFATDSPWSTVEDEMRMLEKAHLSVEDMDMILYKNAEYLLSREF